MPSKRSRRAAGVPSAAWFKNNVKTAEIAMAAPVVIAHRVSRMMAAGLQPNARDQAEFTRMGQEKMEAAWESAAAMANHALRANLDWMLGGWQAWWRLWSGGAWTGSLERSWSAALQKGLAPVHKRATANARRLGREAANRSLRRK